MFKESFFGPVANFPVIFFLVLVIWSLFWKGLGLWQSARGGQKYWFVAILILNTVGVLPIVYLAFFQKKNKSK